MKVYLDENLPPFVATPLAMVYQEHTFATFDDEKLGGMHDIPLLRTLRERGYDAIVTRDRAQLRDPDERRAVRDSGLRWIGVADKRLRGLEQITITVSTLIAGMRFVFAHEPAGPTSYALHNVPHTETQRVRVRSIVA
ncbi:PIN-like domain-containing protein [Herbiconiux daphne]|uniref:VapC45 PIN like domain-containing protein n=1 Tax=Herbiconiux daphne TaxID=2970914 RepID=A0ABT2GZ35_9MICO|nr:hypothetical protein [Herbiconiux daphne]MCS5733224.1 hypothetical protein [Herbiconiux daphne]